MTEGLSRDQVVWINEIQCQLTGENPILLDPDGLDAALERPFGGLGQTEFFPGLFDKAGALLHGIAARQVFENGNKRTAWVTATTFLDINGIDLGAVDAVQAEAFVLCVSTVHDFGADRAAEWFEATYRLRRRSFEGHRWGIASIGVVARGAGGQAVANNWRFVHDGEAEETPIIGVDGIYAGWSIDELHLVAHGNPCVAGSECPLR